MNILVTGGTGQVGFELQHSLSCFGIVHAPTRGELDLSDLVAVGQYIANLKPDLIVNAAAWTAVDEAETKTESVYLINESLPSVLADYAAQQNILMIHYSSDYVYPGYGSSPWCEDDLPRPLSVYGASKLAGDKAIQRASGQYLILRTSWVYSVRGNNFMKTMLRLGAERETMSIVADQIGAPTPARMIAGITALAVYRYIQGSSIESGIYHLATKGSVSWHQFALAVFGYAAKQNYPLKVNPCDVTEIKTSDYPTPAVRPLNSQLEIGKLERQLGITLPAWDAQLYLTLSEYLNQQN